MKPSNKGKRRTTFTFLQPQARKVALGADFNQWQPDKHPMKKGSDGLWSKTAYLSPGTYEYKFWVDGTWQIDHHNVKRCRNCFGSHNSIIKIKSKFSETP